MTESSADLGVFLQESAAKRIVQRAVEVLGVSASIHAQDARVSGSGQCQACRYVAGLPWGNQACKKSRQKPLRAALRRRKLVPFLCRMGFSCATIPVLSYGRDPHTITFGPFLPEDDLHGALEQEAHEALQTFSPGEFDTLPFELDDIPAVHVPALLNLAEWTAEMLEMSWRARVEEDPALVPGPMEPEPARKGPRGRRRAARSTQPALASAQDIAAALSAGDTAHARSLVRGALAESPSLKGRALAVRRARTVALTGAVIETAERAGMDTTRCWERMTGFERAVVRAQGTAELCVAAMAVLGKLKPKPAPKHPDVELNRILSERIPNGVTLQEVAEALGENPTAITHRLQRKFGMSFSDYVGRIRVSGAKELLRGTSLKMKDVARRVGLSDPGNFSKLFRKHEGMSPSEYRQRHGRIGRGTGSKR